MNQSATMIVLAKRQAENGVDFTARRGAVCPWCQQRTRIYATRPWEGTVRIRYHRCENPACILARMQVSIKSLEEDLLHASNNHAMTSQNAQT